MPGMGTGLLTPAGRWPPLLPAGLAVVKTPPNTRNAAPPSGSSTGSRWTLRKAD